jgi:tripartite-type tricarboxylate transporter receptor subunit TctC
VGNWSAHVVNGAIYNLPYDLKTAFAPIALLAQAPQIVLSRKDLPASDLKELIAWMKANRVKVTIGTAGAGTPPHIGAVFFLNLTGTEAQFVPYRGGLPAVQDLMAGQLDITISDTISSVPQVRAGTVKAYAITGGMRLAALPDVPSADEAGLPGFHVLTWNALFAPKGVPQAIIDKLNAAALVALADPTVRARQSVHKGANNIQGEARSEDHQGSAGKGCQRRSIVAAKTSMGYDGRRGATDPCFRRRGDPRVHS